jgi:hypothetical protein
VAVRKLTCHRWNQTQSSVSLADYSCGPPIVSPRCESLLKAAPVDLHMLRISTVTSQGSSVVPNKHVAESLSLLSDAEGGEDQVQDVV